MKTLRLAVLTAIITVGNGISLRKQIEHIRKTQKESLALTDADLSINPSETNEGVASALLDNNNLLPLPHRRFFPESGYSSVILGGPSMPSHLPAAEPILPGNTLIRPALNMLKSAVKFPHKDMDNGAGVYGHIDNLGIKYDGLNERVLYSGFRRMPADYVMIIPVKSKPSSVPRAVVSSVVLDLDKTIDDIDLQGAEAKDVFKLGRSFYTQKLGSGKTLTNDRARHLDRLKRYALREGSGDVSSTSTETTNTTTPCVCPTKPEKLKKIKISAMKPLRREVYESNSAESEIVFNPADILNSDNDSQSVVAKKKEWFWNTKNAYNHLKLGPYAPEYKEIKSKSDLKDLRQWWFYHQEDFEPFEEQS